MTGKQQCHARQPLIRLGGQTKLLQEASLDLAQ
ncbi:hypothetical protein THITH_11225 [Thioalkalivibrio paradoxus ARh 1]|uniref:Uncharacterized protein n=1 Tax=Thioalkalivibrio paradoxus ARh 1 TaxID=713585 RepID=W0DSF6_9GAMM|nr:hypothetical protein THITH_11225 [Thioalkalivibrio paradoxus ARh 1]